MFIIFIDTYLYLYLRASGEFDALSFENNTRTILMKSTKLTWNRESKNHTKVVDIKFELARMADIIFIVHPNIYVSYYNLDLSVCLSVG